MEQILIKKTRGYISYLRGENPKNTEKIDLKSFNCFDYPDLIEDGTCWCGTEALLHSEKLEIKTN